MTIAALDARTALLVIDLQKGIVNLPTAHPIPEIIANAVGLLDAFRRIFPRLGETSMTKRIVELVGAA